MKKKSLFGKIITLIAVALVCLILTLVIAFLLGSSNTTVFDFKNLNLANVLPVIFIGGFISCVIVGILILFLAKDIFAEVKNYFTQRKDIGGKEK